MCIYAICLIVFECIDPLSCSDAQMEYKHVEASWIQEWLFCLKSVQPLATSLFGKLPSEMPSCGGENENKVRHPTPNELILEQPPG